MSKGLAISKKGILDHNQLIIGSLLQSGNKVKAYPIAANYCYLYFYQININI
jgi:hypothetical protein